MLINKNWTSVLLIALLTGLISSCSERIDGPKVPDFLEEASGITVEHSSDTVGISEKEGEEYIWKYSTTVRSRSNIVLKEFGMLFFDGQQWNTGFRSNTPETNFAEWYNCPNAALNEGVNYTDRSNWTKHQVFNEYTHVIWYYDGEDRANGNSVSGYGKLVLRGPGAQTPKYSSNSILKIIYYVSIAFGFLLTTAILLRKKPKNTSKWLLAAAILTISLIVWQFHFLVSQKYFDFPHLFFFSGWLNWIIGPLILFHTKSILNIKWSWRMVIHLLPSILVFLHIALDRIFIPAQEKIAILNYILLVDNPVVPLIEWVIHLLGKAHLSVYIICSWILVRRNSHTSKISSFRNLLLVLATIYTIVFLLSLLFLINNGSVIELHSYINLLNSLILLFMCLISIAFPDTVFPQRNVVLNFLKKDQIIFEKVDMLVREQGLYKNPELRITDVANSLKISPHSVSRALNRNSGRNFFDYINRLRVEEVKEKIVSNEVQKYTILALASESGFNSKTSFNRHFKKVTNQTPTEYIRDKKGDNSKIIID